MLNDQNDSLLIRLKTDLAALRATLSFKSIKHRQIPPKELLISIKLYGSVFAYSFNRFTDT